MKADSASGSDRLKHVIEILSGHIDNRDTYHNHKETMAWTAAAFYVVGVLVLGHEASQFCAVAAPSWIALLGLILLIGAIGVAFFSAQLFVEMQFDMRWVAAEQGMRLRRAQAKLVERLLSGGPDPIGNGSAGTQTLHKTPEPDNEIPPESPGFILEAITLKRDRTEKRPSFRDLFRLWRQNRGALEARHRSQLAVQAVLYLSTTLATCEAFIRVTGPLFVSLMSPSRPGVGISTSASASQAVNLVAARIPVAALEWATLGVQVAYTVVTIGIFVAAVWGEFFRTRFLGPRLKLALLDPKGQSTMRGDGRTARYFHLRIDNKRSWVPARSVKLLCTQISKGPKGTRLDPLPLPIPLQFQWSFPQTHVLAPTISTRDTADLGHIDAGSNRFELDFYVQPNDFDRFVKPGETAEIVIRVDAENCPSPPTIRLRVEWEVRGTDNDDAMAQQLVVTQL